MRLAFLVLLGLTPAKTSRTRIVATAPAGFELLRADRPGLADSVKHGIADGAIFARSSDAVFSARAEPGTGPEPECVGHGKLRAKESGRALVAAAVDALPFARVCRWDIATSDGEVMRELRWKPSSRLNVTVRCIPYVEGTPAAEACHAFAASVHPAK